MSERAVRREHERRLLRLNRRSGRVAAGLVAGAAVLAAPAAADAATFTVETLDDPIPGPCDASCTLREAIDAANANAGNDTIVFASGLSGDFGLQQGQIDITDADGVTIDGPDPSTGDSIEVYGDGGVRSFYVTGAADINDLSVVGAFSLDEGGGFLVAGSGSSLGLERTEVRGNTAKYAFGGGIAAVDGATVTIADSKISGNQALAGGGIAAKYGGSIVLADSNVNKNGGGPYGIIGGGVAAGKYGSVAANNITIRGNTSKYLGGGLAQGYSGDVSINNSTISGNASNAGGGLAYIGDSGTAPGSLSVNHSDISGNYSSLGGGFALGNVPPGGTVTIQNSTMSGNGAGPAGYNDSFGYAGLGGAIEVAAGIEGAVSFSNMTLAGNDAVKGGAIALGFSGDAVPTRRKAVKRADEAGIPEQLRMIAEQPEQLIEPGGSLTFDSLTVADNSAGDAGGGIYNGLSYDPGTMTTSQDSIELTNTIVARNQIGTAGNDLAQASIPGGGHFTLNRSLVEVPGGAIVQQNPAGASIIGENPLLGSLRNNGGPTKTMLPATDSPVIDAGGTALTTDQRGAPRPGGIADDIGSVELPDTGITGGRIQAAKTQKVKGKKVIVKVKAGADEPVTGTPSGKIGKYKLVAAAKSIAAGKLGLFKLKPKKNSDKKKIVKKLKKGKKLKANLTVKLKDGAGNSETLKTKVKVKRKGK